MNNIFTEFCSEYESELNRAFTAMLHYFESFSSNKSYKNSKIDEHIQEFW